MNIAQLKTFVTVVEHASFSEAARSMGLSQPAVTMQVQALEADLGVTLLDRRYRKVEITESGRALLPYARKVLTELEHARTALEELSETVSGRLLFAASTTPGQYVLPRLLGGFLKQYPEVGVSLRVFDTAEVIEKVESGEAQLGMTGAEVHGARVEYERLGHDDLVMICAPNHPLLATEAVRFADLVDESFIVRESGSGTRMVFEDAMRHGGVDPAELRVVMELSTNEAIVSAVEGGMGIGVVSTWVADKALQLGTVAQVPEGSFPLVRPLFLVMPRTTTTRAAAALTDYLREALET
ncbi:MAG: selenium metabolism-associated LysR family transcriptional regulator [Coriobacteriia bacterium]|nr:selenium metabolism-associated LysR family transcriptional regulator [Coriobacteriia bacterium]